MTPSAQVTSTHLTSVWNSWWKPWRARVCIQGGHLCFHSLQLRGQRGLWMLALKVLLEGFWIRHLGLEEAEDTHGSGNWQGFHSNQWQQNWQDNLETGIPFLLASLILTLHTRQVNTRAALAAVFWSWPLAFFSSACFLAFFCWDWIFWCPRAILTSPEKEKMGGFIFTLTQQ